MITFMHRQFREHFCAQYLVGSITLTVLDSTAITGGEEQHALFVQQLYHVVVEIPSLLGILKDKKGVIGFWRLAFSHE